MLEVKKQKTYFLYVYKFKIKFFIIFKGNPNFQGILNWILQILLYYWSKQHTKKENLQFIEQNIALCALLSVYCDLYFLGLSHSTLQNFKRHKWSFVLLHRKLCLE